MLGALNLLKMHNSVMKFNLHGDRLENALPTINLRLIKPLRIPSVILTYYILHTVIHLRLEINKVGNFLFSANNSLFSNLLKKMRLRKTRKYQWQSNLKKKWRSLTLYLKWFRSQSRAIIRELNPTFINLACPKKYLKAKTFSTSI